MEIDLTSYQENYETTVRNTLTELEQSEQKYDSLVIGESLSLFHSQGAVLKAFSKLEDSHTKLQSAQQVKSMGSANENLSKNVNTSTVEAAKDTDESVKNCATAASNVQTAAQSIAKVSADIGSLYNIALATIHGSDVEQAAKETNKQINETSYLAEQASDLAMETSAYTSEIIAKQVKTSSDVCQKDMENLIKATDKEFEYWNSVYTANSATFKKAGVSEKSYEEVLTEYKKEQTSTVTAYTRSNNELNYNLDVDVSDANEFTVSFNEKYFLPNGSNENVEYYVIIVPNQKKTMLTVELAESAFSVNPERFYNVKATESTPAYTLTLSNTDVDIDGNQLTYGVDYVAFVFIEPSTAYKRSINNFMAILSAPSKSFELLTSLQAVESATYTSDTSITFEPVATQPDGASVEYRCIFIPSDKGVLPVINMDLNVANHVSLANYTPVKAGTGSNTLEITDITTDCFGDKLDFTNPAMEYLLYIVSKAEHNSPFADAGSTQPFKINPKTTQNASKAKPTK